MARLEEIEGIGPSYASKLQDAGVQSVEALLKSGGTRAGRKELAEQTGLSPDLILRWVNHADLFRIRGVAGEYAELLEAAGVDSMPELARRNPDNLAAALVEANETRKLVRQVPSAKQVANWVNEAKTLERAVHH
jgi:predicted flap endonuclease-1-like 5' DNA nuclease